MFIHPELRGNNALRGRNALRIVMTATVCAPLALAPHIERPETITVNHRNSHLAPFVVRKSIDPEGIMGENGNFLRSYAALLERERETERQSSPIPETPALEEWLLKLRDCETGGNYREDTGNGYYGAYQFYLPTWDTLHTGYANPIDAPSSVQDHAIIINTLRSPGGLEFQNPACSKEVGDFPPGSTYANSTNPS